MSSSIPSWQILTAHAQPFRGARDLTFCLNVPLDSLLVWASSDGFFLLWLSVFVVLAKISLLCFIKVILFYFCDSLWCIDWVWEPLYELNRLQRDAGWRFVDSKSAKNLPEVCANDCSKAVVLVWFLFCAPWWFLLRGISCTVLSCSMFSCFLFFFFLFFFCDHLAWGRESWCTCFSCICIYILHAFLFCLFLFLLM